MKREGLSAQQRVRRRADFELAYSAGQKRVGEHCVLFARSHGGPLSRLGVTATRKLGNAVRRNQARRLVREAFRRVRVEIPSGYDYVFVARKSIFSSNLQEIMPEISRLAREATR